MIATFFLIVLSIFIENIGYSGIFILILWLSWLIYSIFLLTSPKCRFHGIILFLIWILTFIGFLYLFFSSTGPPNPVYKVINILDLYCKDGRITIILLNDGTRDIKDSELFVMVDNVNKSDSFNFATINPRTTTVATSSDTYEMNKVHKIVVVSPSNSVRSEVWCE